MRISDWSSDVCSSDLSRLLRRSFDERTRVIGITGAQWRLLFTVSRNEGQNQGATAELLAVEPITLCRMIDRMEDAGMVERRPDPNARRASWLYLTDKERKTKRLNPRPYCEARMPSPA